MERTTRRRMLQLGASTAAAAGLAGCLDSLSDGSSDATAQATFFVFGDIAAAVAGDATETELLVPIGQHGHGWEPGPRVREEIYDAKVLFHGMDGFQPWVDDIRSDLADDDAGVTTVDVSDDIGLLEANAEHTHTDNHGDNRHGDHSDEGHHDTATSHREDGHHGEGEHHESEESQKEDGHDHADEGSADPHFWLDPLRVKTAVTNVQQGLATVAADSADTYSKNADAYIERLDSLHEQFRDLREAASKEVLLVAGHDAFQYFGNRYNVRIEALTDISPDDQPTTQDIEQAQTLIAEHDLKYICADPLESQQAARRLVEDTDAEAVLPLTAMPGLKEEWDDDDWGYIEVMENVNYPTLVEALDAQ